MTNQNILGGSVFAINPTGLGGRLFAQDLFNGLAFGMRFRKLLSHSVGYSIRNVIEYACFGGPPAVHSGKDNPLGKSADSTPFCCSLGCATNVEQSVVSLVVALAFLRRPSAIPRAVMPVYVNSVNAMLRGGLLANVCQEILKRLVEKLYAPASVIGECRIIGIVASVSSANIRYVLRGSAKAVGRFLCYGCLGTVASAPSGPASGQMTSGCSANFAALTLTEPHRVLPLPLPGIAQNGVSDKGLACDINESWVAGDGLKNQFAFLKTIHAENKNAHVKGYPTSKMRVGNYVGGGKIVELSHSVGSGIKIRNKPVPKPLKSNKPTLL